MSLLPALLLVTAAQDVPFAPPPTLGHWTRVREVVLEVPEGCAESLPFSGAALLRDGSIAALTADAHELLVYDVVSGRVCERRRNAALDELGPTHRGEVLDRGDAGVWVAPLVIEGAPELRGDAGSPRRFFSFPAHDAVDGAAWQDLPGSRVVPRGGGVWCATARRVLALDENLDEVGALHDAEGPVTLRLPVDLDASEDGRLAVLDAGSSVGTCGDLGARVGPAVVHLADAQGLVERSFTPPGDAGDEVRRVELEREALLVFTHTRGAFELTLDGRFAAPLVLHDERDPAARPLDLRFHDASSWWLGDQGRTLTLLEGLPRRLVVFRRSTPEEAR